MRMRSPVRLRKLEFLVMKRGVLIGFATVAALGAVAAIGIHFQSATPGESSLPMTPVRHTTKVAGTPAVKSTRPQPQAVASVSPGLPPAYQLLLRRTLFAPAASPAGHSKTKTI